MEESGGLHVLDAKLRVDRSDGAQSWREDDLLKMHSYRDALPRVHGNDPTCEGPPRTESP